MKKKHILLSLILLFTLSILISVLNQSSVIFNYVEYILLGIGAIGSGLVYYVYYVKNKVDPLETRIEALEAELSELVRIDELTKIPNRKSLLENIDRNVRLVKREKHSIAFLVIDIDDFKEYNNLHGTTYGDSILKRLATTISASCKRPLDFVGRYGGEEFVVVLPNIDFEGVRVVCDRINQSIRELRIQHYKEEFEFLTVSIGYSVFKPNQEDSYEPALNAAETEMFKVKNTGKNAVMGIDLTKGEQDE